MIISTSLKTKKKNKLVKKNDKKGPAKKPAPDDLREFNEYVNKEETGVNSKLFRKHFSFHRPMLKVLYTMNDKKKISGLVNVISSRWNDLKKISWKDGRGDEKEIEKPNKIVDIVEKILEFNTKNQIEE